jgi:hypothetical protein
MITPPYRHPRWCKDEIEKAIRELLAMGHIRPSNSPFASSIVLVLVMSPFLDIFTLQSVMPTRVAR